jgi:hypothetical protein
VVTIAADASGPDVAKQWIDAAKPSHWTLLDPDLAVANLYNVRNVPSAFWIDETGRIVRANDPIYALRRDPAGGDASRNEAYLNAVRDWVANGPSSKFLADDAVIEKRRRPASFSDMEAMANFELGVYLLRRGQPGGAQRHFDRAQELAPDNWTYRRQAWSLSGATRETIVKAIRDPAAPAFYPELDLGA